jgi:16S rRNA (adenine1518-N6/adenine1519-N6)-dimethyltransferase
LAQVEAIGDLPPLRDIIAAYGLTARKSLGQHFLLDLNLTRRIARAGGDLAGATVIEVGPGPGGLTRAIFEAGAARIIAIEKDRRCRDALAGLEAAAGGRLTVIDADALDVDEGRLAAAQGEVAAGIRIIANLPYNVATVLIIKWLRQIAASPGLYSSLVITVQKEVAARFCAVPRTKAYGRLSVMCQWLTEAKICFDISARAFTPPPRVTSSVVCLTPRGEPMAPAQWDDMETLVAAAFGQRRKMLRSSLAGGTLAADAAALLAASGINPRSRAEEVDVVGFCTLARAYRELRGGFP